MAAVISQANACRYYVAAPSAVAALAYHDEARAAAILANPDVAPIAQPLRVTLSMLTKLAQAHHVDADDDMRMLLAAGASRAQIEDARAIGFAFNIINRFAEAFEFPVTDANAVAVGVRFLTRPRLTSTSIGSRSSPRDPSDLCPAAAMEKCRFDASRFRTGWREPIYRRVARKRQRTANRRSGIT